MNNVSAQAVVKPTIDTLVFALLVDVMERSQHLDRRDMCSRVINDPLGPILDEEFEKGQSLLSVASREWYIPCRSASIPEPPSP